ncbi:hypothetical protein LSH36_154g01016 [Paralvinella palmiformis]|uniref:Katanin p80 subunit C-terminal domain-containing protein n=1 Tax=Paralvinella palmiformis TaxID=53620 RepID=A0AAD9N8I1_9ANNE|nr:hypothetical protein LSH36_154g01016 [Paralvinella palmiformis]
MNRKSIRQQLLHNKVVTKSRKLSHETGVSLLSPIPEFPQSECRRPSITRSDPDDGNGVATDAKIRRRRRRLPVIPKCIHLMDDDPCSSESLDGNTQKNFTEYLLLGQIQVQHPKLDTILSDRILKLRAARSMCHKFGIRNLVSYLIRIRDEAVLVDLLYILQQLVENNAKCVVYVMELVPDLNQLLGSKYEEYINRSLDLLITMMKAKKCLPKTSG